MITAARFTRFLSTRFLFVFFAIICLNDIVVFVVPLIHSHAGFFRAETAVVAMLSRRLLHVTLRPAATVQMPDSSASWLLLLWNAVIALVVALGWVRFGRPSDDRRLHDVTRTMVRYTLGVVMIAYGFSKLFKLQFWFPTPSSQIETLADSTRFAIAWRFMGVSAGYTIFGGIVESAGAILLFWRRTTTLGALILTGALTNVVLLNFCYGIGVKLIALHLFAMTLWLLLPETRRLLDLLIFHRTCAPPELRPFALSRRANRLRLAVKTLALLWFVGTMTYKEARTLHRRGDNAPKPALWGVYDVEEFRRDGKALPLLAGDATLWHQVAFGRDFGPDLCILTMDGDHRLIYFDHDEAKGKITLHADEEGDQTLAVRKVDATHLELAGQFFGQSIQVRLRWRDMSTTPLLTHQFHWVQETNGEMQ